MEEEEELLVQGVQFWWNWVNSVTVPVCAYLENSTNYNACYFQNQPW